MQVIEGMVGTKAKQLAFVAKHCENEYLYGLLLPGLFVGRYVYM